MWRVVNKSLKRMWTKVTMWTTWWYQEPVFVGLSWMANVWSLTLSLPLGRPVVSVAMFSLRAYRTSRDILLEFWLFMHAHVEQIFWKQTFLAVGEGLIFEQHVFLFAYVWIVLQLECLYFEFYLWRFLPMLEEMLYLIFVCCSNYVLNGFTHEKKLCSDSSLCMFHLIVTL